MDLRVSTHVRARRGARGGDPRLHGAHQADRRSARACCSASWRSAGLLDNTHDRVHLRPRRLPGRPLDGREGPVPRAVGEGAADRLRSLGRRPTAARGIGVRRAGRVDRPCPDLPARRWAPTQRQQSHRLEGRSLVPFLRGETPAAVAPLRHQRVRLFDAARRGQARRRAARRAPLHGGRQALEIRPRRRASGRCSTTCETDPDEFRDLGADPACEANAQRLGGRARRMGPAAVPAHDALGAADARPRAASPSAAAS